SDNWPQQIEGSVEEKPLTTPQTKTEEKPKPAEKEPVEISLELEKPVTKKQDSAESKEPVFTVEEPVDVEKLAEQLVEEHGLYDPTMDLSSYKFPPLEMLNEYDTGKAGVTQEELNQNKDRI